MQFTFVYIATHALHFFIKIFKTLKRNNIIYENLMIKNFVVAFLFE